MQVQQKEVADFTEAEFAPESTFLDRSPMVIRIVLSDT